MDRINRIKEVLINKEKTQQWLATKMGYSPQTINLMCNNRRQPSLKDLRRIALILEVDIKDLLYSTLK